MKNIYLLLSLLALAGNNLIAQITVTNFSTGYSAPVDIKNCGDDRLFIVEQPGIISICDTDGVRRPTVFLDIQARVAYGGEQGLLGLAFPPDFLTSGYFYVNYTGNDGDTRVSRFHITADPNIADSNSEEEIIKIYQPFSNHNGGHVGFGPDGYLYIGMGDGGSGGDPGNRAQNPDSLLGKMLRIEVDPSYPLYHIPPTNFYANDTTQGRPEIWALGMRNPWRWSFDRATGDLWIGDVGQNVQEEVDMQPANAPSGLNYGWKCWEGTNQYSSGPGCQAFSSYVAPVHSYNHTPYCSITGGYIYRGTKFQELYGKYFYADYCNSQIQYIQKDSLGAWDNTNLGSIGPSSVTTFGEDRHGEIYVSSNGNKIMKFSSANCAPVSTINFGRDTVSDCGAGFAVLQAPMDSAHTYTWTYNSATIGTSSSQVASQDGMYYVTVDNQGCTSTDSIMVVFSTAAPVTFSGLDTIYCMYNSPVILIPSTPGGTFTGSGMNGNGFYPQNAGIGTHQIIYSITDALGCLSTDTQSTYVDACLGIPMTVYYANFNVVPNPSGGNFHLETTAEGEKTYSARVMDVTGRMIYKKNFTIQVGINEIPFDLNCSPGIYFMEITDGSNKLLRRVVVR